MAFLLVRLAGAEGWPTRQEIISALDPERGWDQYLNERPCWDKKLEYKMADDFLENGGSAWMCDDLRELFPAPGPMTDPVGDKPCVLLARAEQQIAELKSRLAELEAGVSIISEYENRVEPPEGAALTALALLSDGGKPCPDCADGDDPGYLTSLDPEGEPYPHYCPRCGGLAIVPREGA